MGDPFACCEIECEHLSGRPLLDCERQHCPFAFQRRREEDAVERECKIRIAEEARAGAGRAA
ncbi:MAG: hypothetical protein M1377_00605 [Deltaproteobacteria bacterium]|nr:hypothetical protein [Deltaproteobacteria bacterium]